MTDRPGGLTLPRLLTALLFIAVFTMAVRVPADTDTWWHLATGRYIVESRTIPLADPFSHTRLGVPWIDAAWLAQIVLYGLYAVGGWAGLSLGVAALVTLAFVLVHRQSQGNPYLRALGVVVGAITSSVIWAARPQLVSFLLAALVAYLLDGYKRRRGKLLPWLPLVTLVWANAHAGYAIAFILMMCYLLGEGLKRGKPQPLISPDGHIALRRLLAHTSDELSRRAVRIAGLLKLGEGKELRAVLSAARKTALDEARDLEDRCAAVRLFAAAPLDELVDVAGEFLDARQMLDLQLAAVETLATADEPQVSEILLADFGRHTPRLQAALVEAVFARENRLTGLLDALESGQLHPSALSVAYRVRLIENRDSKIRDRAQERVCDDREWGV